jgi:hypothetical protein
MLTFMKVLQQNGCDYEQREQFLLFCVHGDGREHNVVQWEMEVIIKNILDITPKIHCKILRILV